MSIGAYMFSVIYWQSVSGCGHSLSNPILMQDIPLKYWEKNYVQETRSQTQQST